MIKRPYRPILGGTHNGERPRRYDYWRTGYHGTQHTLQFWVKQAGEYHCKSGYIVSDREPFLGTLQFFYHIDGFAKYSHSQYSKNLTKGDLLIIPKGLPFHYEAPNGMKYHWIAIEGEWPSQFFTQKRFLSLDYHHALEDRFLEVREALILQQPGYEMKAISAVFAIMARVQLLLGQGASPESQYPEPIRDALAILREQYAEPFNAQRIATAVSLSPSHLRSLFQKWVGETPQQFHNRNRIDQARRLLQEQNLPVYEVAYHVGFNDARYFARVFKQLTGVSPSQYSK